MPWMVAIAAGIVGFVPFIGWLASVLIGVTTLQRGIRAGLLVTCFAMIPCIVSGWSGSSIDYWSMFFSCIYVWLMAGVLLKTSSWSQVLTVTTVIALALIVILHTVSADIDLWWYRQIIAKSQVISTQLADLPIGDLQLIWNQLVNAVIQQGYVKQLSYCMTGGVITGAMIINLFNLIIARWWCYRHDKKAKVGDELMQVRPHLAAASVFALVTVVAYFLPSCRDAFVALAMLFLCSGLCLLHWLTSRVKGAWLWLSLGYLILIFFPLPTAIVLTLLSVVDAIFNVRKFVERHVSKRGV